jgi:hypothetical protein
MCEHTALVAFEFSPAYQVTEVLVVETPALRKKTSSIKTSSIRNTAWLRRKLLIKEIAKQKKQSTKKLAYMDPLVHPQLAPAPP